MQKVMKSGIAPQALAASARDRTIARDRFRSAPKHLKVFLRFAKCLTKLVKVFLGFLRKFKKIFKLLTNSLKDCLNCSVKLLKKIKSVDVQAKSFKKNF